MTIRHSLLALLADEPAHSYQLKSDFEDRTGGAWMLNIGQVYSTLQRLERDGLVRAADTEDQRTTYALTALGEQALGEWFTNPIVVDPPPRDELTLKVLLAVGADHADLVAILQRQRTAAVEHLQALTRQKAAADPDDLPWLLLLDALVLRAEAEIRWLDMCDSRVTRARADRRAADSAATGTADGDHDDADPTVDTTAAPRRWGRR